MAPTGTHLVADQGPAEPYTGNLAHSVALVLIVLRLSYIYICILYNIYIVKAYESLRRSIL
jgi:hypothetical protein